MGKKTGKKNIQKNKNEEFKLKAGWHRCSLSKFIEVVSNLNEEKRKNVEDIGFGNMLNLKCSFLSTKLFSYFVQNFDGQKCRIRLQEDNVYLPINAIDVQSIFGIPAGIIPVPICKIFDSDWVNEGGYHNDKEMHVDQLMDKVKNMEAGKDFKRAFVLFACAAVLSPNGRYHAHVGLWKAVDDVNAITSYNWCTYVRNCLVNSLKTVEDGDGKQMYIGCVIFLQLLYLMRCEVQYPYYDTKDTQRLGFWETKLVCERLRWEHEMGGFGYGQLVTIRVRPYYRNANVSPSRHGLSPSHSESYNDSCSDTVLEHYIKDLQVEIMQNAKNSKKKLHRLESLLRQRRTQKRPRVFSKNNEEGIADGDGEASYPTKLASPIYTCEGEQFVGEKMDTIGDEEDAPVNVEETCTKENITSPIDTCEGEQFIREEMDRIGEQQHAPLNNEETYMKESIVSPIYTCEGEQIVPEEMETIGEQQHVPRNDNDTWDIPISGLFKMMHGVEMPSKEDRLIMNQKAVLNDVVSTSVPVSVTTIPTVTFPIHERVTESSPNTEIEQIGTPSKNVIAVSDSEVGENIKKHGRGSRILKPGPYSFSPWAIQHGKSIRLKKDQTKLLSYVAATGHEDCETLVVMYGQDLFRCDMVTLFEPNLVSSAVINFWGNYLNNTQGECAKKFVLNSNAVQFMDNSGVVVLKSAEKRKVVLRKVWEDYNRIFKTDPAIFTNTDLLCFPSCIKSHWFLLVVNHPEKTIDYICSKGSPHVYKQYALCVKELMEVACGKEWSKYLVRIPLKIPEQPDATSCGIFVMKFMELWDGKKLSKKLKKKPELMRSEFLLKLLDNPLNERRTELYRLALA